MTDTIMPPSSRTAVEVAFDRAIEAAIDLDPGIRALKRPLETPDEFLGYLAWEHSLDLWDDDWPEEKKRDVIRRSFELHSLKGTRAGISRHLEIAGALHRRTYTHAHRAFASAPISKEQRDAWLARMPQIRVYLHSEQGTKGADAFAGIDFAGHSFARMDRGAAIYGRKAVLWRPDGTEVSLRRVTVEETTETRQGVEYDRVYIPGDAGPATFARRDFAGRCFASPTKRPATIVTVALDRAYVSKASRLHLGTAWPSLTPIDVKYERVSKIGTEGPALFAGQAKRGFAVPDRGEWMLYDRIYLHDRDQDTPWTRAHSFAGHARLGRAPYDAEMFIEAIGRMKRKQAHVGHVFVNRAFATREDASTLRRALEAVRVSKAIRDRIKIDPQAYEGIRFGGGIPFDGSVRFGEPVRRKV